MTLSKDEIRKLEDDAIREKLNAIFTSKFNGLNNQDYVNKIAALKAMFKLDGTDTDNPEWLDFEAKLIKGEDITQEINSLINHVITGILANDPLRELVKTGEFDVWFSGISPDRMSAMICQMLLLEKLTHLMLNDSKFSLAILQQTSNARNEMWGLEEGATTKETFMKARESTESTFGAVKLLSVEPSLWKRQCLRELLEEVGELHELSEEQINQFIDRFIEKHKLNSIVAGIIKSGFSASLEKMNGGFRVNVCEAMIAELRRPEGRKSDENAAAAFGIIRHLESHSADTGIKYGSVHPRTDGSDQPQDTQTKNSSLFLDIPKELVDLYGSWNLTFILGELGDADRYDHYMMAKLLMPSTLSAEPDEYMAARLISLWLTIQWMMFDKDANPEATTLEQPELIAPKYEMIKKAGEINAQYAAKLNHIGKNQLDKEFESVVKKRKLAFTLGLVMSYFRNTVHFSAIDKPISLTFNLTKEQKPEQKQELAKWRYIGEHNLQSPRIIVQKNKDGDEMLRVKSKTGSFRYLWNSGKRTQELSEAWKVFQKDIQEYMKDNKLTKEQVQTCLKGFPIQPYTDIQPLTSRFIGDRISLCDKLIKKNELDAWVAFKNELEVLMRPLTAVQKKSCLERFPRPPYENLEPLTPAFKEEQISLCERLMKENETNMARTSVYRQRLTDDGEDRTSTLSKKN